MKIRDRVEGDLLLREVVGGAEPADGDVIVFSKEEGWRLSVPPEDTTPQITAITVGFDVAGHVWVSLQGNAYCDDMYCTVGISSPPADPTSSSFHGMISNNRTGTVDTNISIDMGVEFYVKARGYDTDENAGPVMQAYFVRGDTKKLPFYLEVGRSQSGTNGVLTLDIFDPSFIVQTIKLDKKVGKGDFNNDWVTETWDSSTGTPGANQTLQRIENVALQPKHDSAIKFQIAFGDPSGDTRYYEDVVSFDCDLIAEIESGEFSVDSSGNLMYSLSADEDTAQIIANIVKNGSLVQVTQANKDLSITGQRGAGDTAIDLAFGDYCNISVGACPTVSGTPDSYTSFFVRRHTGSIGKAHRWAAATGIAGAGFTVEASGAYVHPGSTGSAQWLYLPVRLPAGATITAFRVRYYRAGSSDTIPGLSLAYMNDSASATNVANLANPSSYGGWFTTEQTGLSHTISSSYVYYCVIGMYAATTKTNARVLWVEVNYTSDDIDETL